MSEVLCAACAWYASRGVAEAVPKNCEWCVRARLEACRAELARERERADKAWNEAMEAAANAALKYHDVQPNLGPLHGVGMSDCARFAAKDILALKRTL